MCRFLLLKSKKVVDISVFLEKFATMCYHSKCLDGDDQVVGWGFSYLDQNQEWQTYHSLEPVWQDVLKLNKKISTTHLVVHARSASFENQKGIIEYNQPFVFENFVFVFNGLLKGVKLPELVPGKIGSQKIFNIFKKYIQSGTTAQMALKETVNLLKTHCNFIQALNIGICDGQNLYYHNEYDPATGDYYQLQFYEDEQLQMICSEKLEGFS